MKVAAFYIKTTGNYFLGLARGETEQDLADFIVKDFRTNAVPVDGEFEYIFVMIEGDDEVEDPTFEGSDRVEALVETVLLGREE